VTLTQLPSIVAAHSINDVCQRILIK
jgi:hypothetical protein